MNRIRYIRRIATVLGGLAAALAAFGATPAFARPDPDGTALTGTPGVRNLASCGAGGLAGGCSW
jgi:hypothetical protein